MSAMPVSGPGPVVVPVVTEPKFIWCKDKAHEAYAAKGESHGFKEFGWGVLDLFRRVGFVFGKCTNPDTYEYVPSDAPVANVKGTEVPPQKTPSVVIPKTPAQQKEEVTEAVKGFRKRFSDVIMAINNTSGQIYSSAAAKYWNQLVHGFDETDGHSRGVLDYLNTDQVPAATLVQKFAEMEDSVRKFAVNMPKLRDAYNHEHDTYDSLMKGQPSLGLHGIITRKMGLNLAKRLVKEAADAESAIPLINGMPNAGEIATNIHTLKQNLQTMINLGLITNDDKDAVLSESQSQFIKDILTKWDWLRANRYSITLGLGVPVGGAFGFALSRFGLPFSSRKVSRVPDNNAGSSPKPPQPDYRQILTKNRVGSSSVKDAPSLTTPTASTSKASTPTASTPTASWKDLIPSAQTAMYTGVGLASIGALTAAVMNDRKLTAAQTKQAAADQAEVVKLEVIKKPLKEAVDTRKQIANMSAERTAFEIELATINSRLPGPIAPVLTNLAQVDPSDAAQVQAFDTVYTTVHQQNSIFVKAQPDQKRKAKLEQQIINTNNAIATAQGILVEAEAALKKVNGNLDAPEKIAAELAKVEKQIRQHQPSWVTKRNIMRAAEVVGLAGAFAATAYFKPEVLSTAWAYTGTPIAGFIGTNVATPVWNLGTKAVSWAGSFLNRTATN